MKLRTNIRSVIAYALLGSTLFAGSTAHAATEICISFRGNGPKFPSLLGQSAALLEQGYRPRVSVGGSSGANVAALLQALVENSSLEATANPEQGAARVLRASRRLMDTFVFLPSFDRPITLVRALLTFLRGQLKEDKVAGPAEFSIAHLDHTLAQVLLFVDLYQNQDFSDVLAAPSEAAAAEQLENIFTQSTQGFKTSPEFFMKTLLPADPSDINHPDAARLRKLLAQYLALGKPPTTARKNADDSARRSWSTLGWMKRLNPKQQAWARTAAWNVLRRSSFFPGPAMSSDKSLFFPSPEALQRALGLKSSFSDRQIHVPRGFLSHSTVFQGGSATSENLHQFYFAGETMRADLRAQWLNNGERLPVLSIGETQEQTNVIPPEKIWVAHGGQSLADILRATIAEPLLFERRSLGLSVNELAELKSKSNEPWIANGGWLDTASYPLLRRLEVCDGHPVILVTPRDGINSFQKQALRGLLNLPKPQKGKPDPLRESPIFMNLERYLSASLTDGQDRIILDFDWDSALKNQPAGIGSLRQFLFDSGYQHAKNILRVQP